MNARLEANVLRDWKPGWRTGVAVNIAQTSAIPRRRKRRNGDVWLVCVTLLALTALVLWP